MTHKYEVIIFWSDDDQAFVAEVPELAGCAAHGDTPETALREAQKAISLWIDTAREFGDAIRDTGKRAGFRVIRFNSGSCVARVPFDGTLQG